MIITVASYKGGVSKTTVAIHLAAYLQTRAPTLLLDGDPTRNAIEWSEAGEGLPFRVAPVSFAAKLVPEYAKGHIVIDTGQRLTGKDFKEAVMACDRLIVPTPPGSLDVRSLVQTIQALSEIGADKVSYGVLLSRVPPPPERDAFQLRLALEEQGVPVFNAEIPRLKAFEIAARDGKIVRDVRDKNASRGWDAFTALGKEIAA